MKVMQNYAFRVEASNNPQANSCSCSKCKVSDCLNEQHCPPNGFCKKEDAGNVITHPFNNNRDNFYSKNVSTIELPESKIHPSVNYKTSNLETVQGYVDVDCLSLYIKEVKESNLYGKNTNHFRMTAKSELEDSYSKFGTQEMFTKKQLHRFHEKEVNPHLFSQKNIEGRIYAKNLYSNLEINDDTQLSNRMVCHSGIQDSPPKCSEGLADDQECKSIYDVRNHSSSMTNDLSKGLILKKRPTDADMCSKIVENGLLVPKDEANVHCSSDSVSSFDEESQLTQARMQLVPFSGTKLNLCDICKKSFSTKGNLHNHHIVHSGQKPHECSVCKKTFSQRSTLGKHYLIHTGEKPHVCNVCGRGFRQANNLRIHLLTHSGEKPHRCNVCDKGFTQKIALQKHMLTHTGVKPHECNVCKRCFTTKGNLQKHFLTHTGEKPHVCGICNRGFSQKIALKKHHLTHTGEKPFSCEVCGKRFTTKGNLKSHFKRHTRDKFSTASPSTVSRLATVPKSIADSILMPLPSEHKEQVSRSPISSHSSPPLTKSTLSAFSSHIQHPLLPKNHSIESSMSSFTHPAVHQRTQMLPYQFGQNEEHSLPSSYMVPSVPCSQSSKLAISCASFPVFPSQATPTSNHSALFSSSQDGMMSTGNSTQKSIRGPYSPPLAHSNTKATQPQHVKPSDNILSPAEPQRYTSDTVAEYNTHVRPASPKQEPCNTLSTEKGEMFVQMTNSPSQIDNNTVYPMSLQNLQLHISSELKEKIHNKDMTVL